MLFHHESNTAEIIQEMDDSGYAFIAPAIEPQDLRKSCEDSPELLKYYEEMNAYCIRYARDVFTMRYEQALLSEKKSKGEDTPEMHEELKVIDSNRHSLHEAMMASVNMLSRELIKRDKDANWMHEVSSGGRAGYMKFAMRILINTLRTPKHFLWCF